MRLFLVVSALLASTFSVDAFAPSSITGGVQSATSLKMSTIEAVDVKSRMNSQMEKLKAKDATSKALSKQVSIFLDLIFEARKTYIWSFFVCRT